MREEFLEWDDIVSYMQFLLASATSQVLFGAAIGDADTYHRQLVMRGDGAEQVLQHWVQDHQ